MFSNAAVITIKYQHYSFFFFQNILFLPDLAAASFSVFNEFAGESS